MKIILTHIIRNIKEKKGRSFLIILSLMIASVVFILNLTIPKQIVDTKAKQSRDAIGLSDIMVASFDQFNINDIKLNNEKIKYVGVNDLYLIHKDKTFVIYGTDIANASSLNLVGNINLSDDEVIISKTTANKYDYKVNDIITIDVEENLYNLKIKDVVDNNGLLYFKTLSGLVNNNTFNKITNNINSNYRTYYIDVLNDENVDSFNTYVKDNNKEYMVEKLIDTDKILEENQYTIVILTIIFIMATVMIFFVVSTLNKMIVLERMPVIGTFRSIGASKRKMNILLILENSIYGLIGGSFGGILSLLIYKIAIKILLNGVSVNSSIPMMNLILGVVFTMVLEILMSIAAIIKSNKYSIKEIMFESKNSKSGFDKCASAISILLIVISILLYIFVDYTNLMISLFSTAMFWIGVAYFIPTLLMIFSRIICGIARKIGNGSLLMAGKNLGYNKLLVSSTRLVVISASIMLVILNVSFSFNKSIDKSFIQSSDYDGMVRDITKKYYEYDSLENINNIENIEYSFMSSILGNVTYNDGKKFNTEPMILGMSSSKKDIEELNYKIKDLKDDECLFDEIFLKNNNLKIGDRVKLYFKDTANLIDVKIVGTVNSYYNTSQREVIVINENVFKSEITEVPFMILFNVKNKDNIRDTMKLMEREIKDPDITILTTKDFIDMQRESINTIMSLFYIIIFLAVILSFVGIINNQLISFMERTKEIAVLNSVCISKRQLRKMLVIENVVSNIVACAFGFFTSIMSLGLINKIMYGFKMYDNLEFNYNIGFLIIGSILVLLLLTVIVPIIKMKKINIVEAIKYE